MKKNCRLNVEKKYTTNHSPQRETVAVYLFSPMPSSKYIYVAYNLDLRNPAAKLVTSAISEQAMLTLKDINDKFRNPQTQNMW